VSDVTFAGGVNIAMKIPKADYEATIGFYRDVLGFELTEGDVSATPTVSRTMSLKFGPNTLWLDCVDAYAHSDLWLELSTNDFEAATERLVSAGINPTDEIEPIVPRGRTHWIRNPAGIVHLLAAEDVKDD
jgi:predicted enzyme related to lactoylglutathione lyase